MSCSSLAIRARSVAAACSAWHCSSALRAASAAACLRTWTSTPASQKATSCNSVNVAALAAYAGLAIAAAAFLREHYLAPMVTSGSNVPGTAWITGQWWTKNGHFAFAGNPPPSLISQCSFPQGGPSGKGGIAGGGGPSSVSPFAQCLAPHGYAQWYGFQPVSRFWPFQWIEGGWLLALSVLLIAVTIWLVRRRAA
jgi:hypothetical protein